MKRTILIILLLFVFASCFSQKYEFINKWVDTGIWEIPKGVDTSINLIPIRLESVDQSIINKIEFTSTETISKVGKYRFVVYRNGAKNVEILVSEKKIRRTKREKYQEIINKSKKMEKLKADSSNVKLLNLSKTK